MDRRLDWIVRNGAFAAALYFAMVRHVDWLMYAIAAFVWWTLARSVWVIPETSPSRPIEPPAVPQASTMAFDLAVLASMFLAHWYWIASAYALSCGCLAVAQARAISKP
jgi:hypothetical protein